MPYFVLVRTVLLFTVLISGHNQVRETMGVADVQYTIDHFKSVFEHFPAVDAELSASLKNSIPNRTVVIHVMRAALR